MSFLTFIKNNSDLLDDEELNSFVETNELTKELINYMNSFSESYNVSLDNEQENIDILIDTFLNSIIILFKHIKNDTGWADSSLKGYIEIVRKILEMLTYIIQLNDEKINEIYFDEYDRQKDKNYYSYLTKLAQNQDENFKIIEGNLLDNKDNKKYILLKKHDDRKVDGKYIYRPVNKHILVSPVNSNQNHIEYFFKTKQEEENNIWRIFNLSRSKGNERKSVGGFRGKAIQLEIYEIVNYIPNKILGFEKIDSNETINDLSQMAEKEVLSPVISEETANDVNEDFFETLKSNSVESSYKQLLINKAISNSYINKNLNLRNDKTKPSLPKLKKFLNYLIDTLKDDIFIDITIFSIVLGFSIEKILYAILGLDKDLKYIKKKKSSSILELNIRKNLFSDFEEMKKHNISLKTTNNAEIHLTEEFEMKLLNIKCEITSYIISQMTNNDSDDNILKLSEIHYEGNIPFDIKTLEEYMKTCIDLKDFEDIRKYTDINFKKKFISEIEEINFTEYYINKWLENKKTLLTKSKKKYKKTINLNFKNIGSLFLYYYRIYNPDRNEFSILLSQNISKNDEVRLKYVSIPKRLVIYEKWIYELTMNLGLDEYFNYEVSNYIPQNINYEKQIGSNNFILPGVFKNFLHELNHLSFEDEIICLNICMIYLRYMFSIQLVSRDIIESSANLSQISKYFNILTIQEKSESVMAAKKILPLTESTIINIEIFYKLKQKYSISSFYPVILQPDNISELEIPVSRKNTFNFFNNLNNKYSNSISETILKFTQYTKLNFGRHIITSAFAEKGIKPSYIDASMNHFVLGKEDQGIFSLFKNIDYDKVIKETITEIEYEYTPIKLSVKDFLSNLKT